MGVTHSRQKRGETFLLDFSVDGRTAIRFFYNPVGNYFHFPLIFRAVEPGDDIGTRHRRRKWFRRGRECGGALQIALNFTSFYLEHSRAKARAEVFAPPVRTTSIFWRKIYLR